MRCRNMVGVSTTMVLQQLHTGLQQELKDLEKELRFLPQGKLKCYNGKKGSYWYFSENGRRKYLKKGDMDTVTQMAKGTYYRYKCEELGYRLFHLEKCMAELVKLDGYAEGFLKDNENICRLLETEDETGKWEKWAEEEYERCTLYKENLKFHTLKGDVVRSKAEVIIADLLYEAGIPYRYEPVIMMGGEAAYPDFLIADRLRDSVVILEFLGMIDDEVYEARNKKKIRTYLDNGWLPGINLILIAESQGMPFDSRWVWDNIRHYFM